MIRPLLLVILLALLLWGWLQMRRKYGRRLNEPAIIALILLGALALVASGKLHWVGAALAAALAALRPLLPWLWRLAPGLLQMWRRRRGGDAPVAGAPMSRAQALAVLGLGEGASREEITEAHRRLIQKLHPDRKGSGHLSRVVNQARDTLLN